MKIIYHDKKVEKLCCDTKKAIRELGKDVANNLVNIISTMKAFTNLSFFAGLPQYRLHALNGDRKFQYSLIIKKGTKWRLVVYPLDENENIIKDINEKEKLIKAVKVEILEVSEHYD